MTEVIGLLNRIESPDDSVRRAWTERDALVCALSKLWPAHLMPRTKDGKYVVSADYNFVVCIHAPVGQLCWTIPDHELPQYAHLKRHERNHWDGHSTAAKYARLATLKNKQNRKG